jgi:hypothetical protein
MKNELLVCACVRPSKRDERNNNFYGYTVCDPCGCDGRSSSSALFERAEIKHKLQCNFLVTIKLAVIIALASFFDGTRERDFN